jgi:hypothetical protein
VTTTTSTTARPGPAATLPPQQPAPALEPVQPFRANDCAGEEAAQLLKQGLVRTVVADVLVAFDAPDSREIRAAAAGLLIPAELRITGGWVVGFGSAAWLHTGLVVGLGADAGQPPTELQVITPPGRRRPTLAGVRGRQVALSPEQVIFLGPVPVTDPVRTAADVARDLPTAEAVAALHRLGELCGVRPPQVLQMLGTMRYARGAATARQVIKAWTES